MTTMHKVICFGLVGILASIGSVFSSDPPTAVRLPNEKTAGLGQKWYSVTHFTNLAKEHVLKNRPDFDMSRTQPQVWFCVSDGPELVLVVFGSGIGKPVCSVWLDKNGLVLKDVVAIAKA